MLALKKNFLNTVFQNLLIVILLVTECYCRQFAEEIDTFLSTYWILHTTYWEMCYAGRQMAAIVFILEGIGRQQGGHY